MAKEKCGVPAPSPHTPVQDAEAGLGLRNRRLDTGNDLTWPLWRGTLQWPSYAETLPEVELNNET